MTSHSERTERVCDIQISADLDFFPGRCRMTFDTDRPLEVVFCFDALDGKPEAVWTFARELVTDALGEERYPFGDGDVSVMVEGAKVSVVLESPEGTAMVQFPRYDVELFVTECSILAPVGGSLVEQRVASAVESLIEELSR